MGQVSWLLELDIKDGALDDFHALMKEMVNATQSDEPGTIGYEWSTNSENTVCHIYESYSDSAAVMAHLGNFGQKFAERFMQVLSPTRFCIYGSPSAEVKEALAPFGPTYMASVGGFTR